MRGSDHSTARGFVLRAAQVLLTWCVALGCLAGVAAAQGCAMCYQNAAASGAQGRAALRHGTWILLVPACTVFLGICTLIYRRRNTSR
jgi:hypothetical protein